MINNENWMNPMYTKKMKDIKFRFWIVLIIFIIGCCLVATGKYVGIGLMFGGITAAVINIIRALRLIEDKMKQTEDRIKKLEEEIEILKKEGDIL